MSNAAINALQAALQQLQKTTAPAQQQLRVHSDAILSLQAQIKQHQDAIAQITTANAGNAQSEADIQTALAKLSA